MNYKARRKRIHEFLAGLDEALTAAKIPKPKGKLMRFGEFLLAKRYKDLMNNSPQNKLLRP
jgi:hypothetical protein